MKSGRYTKTESDSESDSYHSQCVFPFKRESGWTADGLDKAERIMSYGEGQMMIDVKDPQVTAPFQENKSMHLHKPNV